MSCTTCTASKWRVRYARDRLAGLAETGDRGAAPKYGPAHQKRILAMLDQPPPSGYSNWTAPLLARALVDVHEQYIWRFLRAQRIDLSGRKSWCESTDPQFVAKAPEIVGLYMAPPKNAVVLSIDEKPSIQALERAQEYLKLPSGRAMIGQSIDGGFASGSSARLNATALGMAIVIALVENRTAATRLALRHLQA